MVFQQVWVLAVLLVAPFAAGCIIDPDSTDSLFHLIGPDYTPLIKSGDNQLQHSNDDNWLSASNDGVPPVFYFQKSASASGNVYDLVLADDGQEPQYVAAADDGSYVLTSASTGSSGQNVNGVTITTSIFTVDCEGRVGVSRNGESSPFTVGSGSLVAFNFDGQTFQDYIDSLDSLESRSLVKRAEAYRCPPGFGGSVKPGARAAFANGCGSVKTHKFVPELVFHGCCDNHDFCFDDCATPSLSYCNDIFHTCMNDSCYDHYNHGIKRILLPGCLVVAQIYYDAVNNDNGVSLYNGCTNDRCVCTRL